VVGRGARAAGRRTGVCSGALELLVAVLGVGAGAILQKLEVWGASAALRRLAGSEEICSSVDGGT
jgi:hypothetical protein